MATWQYDIHFIPREILEKKYGLIPVTLDFEEAMSVLWWSDLNLEAHTLLPVLQQFGDIQAWTETSAGIKMFGDPAGNDITLCYNDQSNKVETLSSRLDLRTIDKNLITKVLSLAKQYDCLLLDAKGQLFLPTPHALSSSIQSSAAMRFVSDPIQFLNELSNSNTTPDNS